MLFPCAAGSPLHPLQMRGAILPQLRHLPVSCAGSESLLIVPCFGLDGWLEWLPRAVAASCEEVKWISGMSGHMAHSCANEALSVMVYKVVLGFSFGQTCFVAAELIVALDPKETLLRLSYDPSLCEGRGEV